MPDANVTAPGRLTVSGVREWWIATRGHWARMAELRELPPGELERVAADFGVSSAELLDASRRNDSTPGLLERRLAALELDPEEIWKLSPVLLRNLQRTCSTCPERRRCKDDMATSPLVSGWDSYCPNADSLLPLL